MTAAAPSRDGPRVNEDIRSLQVRLIDAEGEMQGVMSARDAMLRAMSVGLDLLEISPNADPPVVKILDYGKFKYESQKKKNEAKKKQKVVEIKEVKVRPNIDENDYQVKMRAMNSFIDEGDKVKVTCASAAARWRTRTSASRCWSASAATWTRRPRSSRCPAWRTAR